MQLNPLRKRPHSARKVQLTYDSLVGGYNGAPALEVVEAALFYLQKQPPSDEASRLEELRAQLQARAAAWAGFEPLQVVAYRVSPNDPLGGDFRILSIRVPADSAPFFVGVALTAMFDWSDGGKKIADAGDPIEVLVAHTDAKTKERAYG